MPRTRAKKRSRAIVVELTSRAHERLIARAQANGNIASHEATLLLEALLEREAGRCLACQRCCPTHAGIRLAAMTTMTGASRARTHIGSHTEHTTVNADDIALELDNSQSSVIYVDIPGMTDDGTAAMLTGEPPLHVEHDAVRDKWAVRKATAEEVAEAQAADAAPTSESADTAASSA